MRTKETFEDVGDDCKYGFSGNFMKSLGSQIGGILGASSLLDHTGVNVESELMEKIFELESQLKEVQWHCTQQLFLEQDKNNEERVQIFQGLYEYLNTNNQYITTKYMFEENKLGILEGSISVMTTLVMFVILYFLKFK